MTSAAMIINYFARFHNPSFSTTPRELNNWLNDQTDGYTAGNVIPAAVVRYARNHNIPLTFVTGTKKRDDFTLDSYLCGGNPVMLNVHSKAHFVLATGQTTVGTTDTYKINDPGYNRSDLTSYNNTYDGLRLYKTSNTPPSALYVIAHSPVEILVTDPNGRKTGLDPRTGTEYNEIPNGSYYSDSIGDDVDDTEDSTPETKIFTVQTPLAGNYSVQIINTGDGPFQIDFLGYDTNGNLEVGMQSFEGTASSNSLTNYTVGYSPTVGSTITVCSPPSFTNISVTPSAIWPPNKDMVDIQINYTVTTTCGASVITKISSVSSNEPITPADAVIVNGNLVRLRADRLGTGAGRVYTITLVAVDSNGNQTSQNVNVTVPHDQRR